MTSCEGSLKRNTRNFHQQSYEDAFLDRLEKKSEQLECTLKEKEEKNNGVFVDSE